jgi:hypothetical protein
MSILEFSLTRSRQPSGSQVFWWWMFPGLSLSQRLLMVICLPWLYHTDFPLHSRVSPYCAKTSGSFSGSDLVDAGPGYSARAQHQLQWTSWEVRSDLHFCRDPEKIEKEEPATAEKAVKRRNFRANALCQLLGSPLLSLRSQRSAPVQQSLWRAGASSRLLYSPHCSGHSMDRKNTEWSWANLLQTLGKMESKHQFQINK